MSIDQNFNTQSEKYLIIAKGELRNAPIDKNITILQLKINKILPMI